MTDEVHKLDVPWLCEPGAPMPVLFQPEGRAAVLTFLVAEIAPTTKRFAAVRFPRCWALKFGYPNDEALSGHPLYEKGLGYYGFFEVTDSSWRNQLHEQNRRALPSKTGDQDGTSRHFVVTFHDSTFECLAEGMEGRFVDSLQDALVDDDGDWESV